MCARGAHSSLLGGPSISTLADIVSIKRFSVLSAIAVSVVFAAYDGWLFSRDLTPDEGLFTMHRFVVAALCATWLVADARESQRTRPTFDQGSFALYFFVAYVPYYLISTRRGRGVLALAGVCLLFLLPRLAELIASYVS